MFKLNITSLFLHFTCKYTFLNTLSFYLKSVGKNGVIYFLKKDNYCSAK